jgi:hypothetical protein
LTTQAGLTLSSSTLTTGSVLSISVTGTAHTTAGAGLIVSASGANTAPATTTTSASFSNTRTGGTSTNIALSLSASGGTTNYALDVAAGIVRLGVGTTSFPQMVFTPSAGIALPGSTNGSLIYDTVSSNSSLSLYKDVAYTKLVTIARNPDFVGSTNGVVISDALGNLTKSGELTAFGIFSGTADGTALTASGNADLLPTTVVGSKTLPASFFGVGKTIEVFVSGKITTTGSPGNLVLKLQFGSTPTDIATITLPLHQNITNGYWDARFIVVCRTTGATGGISANGVARMETDTNANMVYGDVVVPAVLPTINTAAAQDIKVNGAITVSNSVTIQNCYANYLN